MRRTTSLVLIFTFCVTAVFAQDLTSSFDGNKMIERVKRLSADDFEGRGPGTDGGRRAAQYIVDQLKASGVKPGNKGSYFQNVKLVGVKASPQTALRVGENGASNGKIYKFGDDFVATTGAQAANVSVSAEIVFVGYGIDAPLYNWNDYKGAADDYKGKVLMMLVNDPPATDAEPNLFGGKALTYFGRWTYKYEEAARRGAAGVVSWSTQPNPPAMAGTSSGHRTAVGVTRSLGHRRTRRLICNSNHGRQTRPRLRYCRRRNSILTIFAKRQNTVIFGR